MLMIAVLLLMGACGVAQYRNGLFTSFAMLIAVFLSGFVAFGFFEPIAEYLEPMFQGNMLAGTEDMLALVALFTVTLLVLRLATNYLCPELIEENGILQHFGGGAVGLITGYFLAGFLICAMQTLPIDEKFMDFEPRSSNEPPYRGVFPPDRIWLSMMRHASAGPFNWKEESFPASDSNIDRFVTFDRSGTFELRYLRYRRGQMPYMKEFEVEIGKQRR